MNIHFFNGNLHVGLDNDSGIFFVCLNATLANRLIQFLKHIVTSCYGILVCHRIGSGSHTITGDDIRGQSILNFLCGSFIILCQIRVYICIRGSGYNLSRCFGCISDHIVIPCLVALYCSLPLFQVLAGIGSEIAGGDGKVTSQIGRPNSCYIRGS